MRESVENPMVRNVSFDEPRVVAACTNENCKAEFTQRDTFVKFLDEYFCDEDCVFEHHDLIYIEGDEI